MSLDSHEAITQYASLVRSRAEGSPAYPARQESMILREFGRAYKKLCDSDAVHLLFKKVDTPDNLDSLVDPQETLRRLSVVEAYVTGETISANDINFGYAFFAAKKPEIDKMLTRYDRLARKRTNPLSAEGFEQRVRLADMQRELFKYVNACYPQIEKGKPDFTNPDDVKDMFDLLRQSKLSTKARAAMARSIRAHPNFEQYRDLTKYVRMRRKRYLQHHPEHGEVPPEVLREIKESAMQKYAAKKIRTGMLNDKENENVHQTWDEKYPYAFLSRIDTEADEFIPEEFLQVRNPVPFHDLVRIRGVAPSRKSPRKNPMVDYLHSQEKPSTLSERKQGIGRQVSSHGFDGRIKLARNCHRSLCLKK